jgi:protein TonB
MADKPALRLEERVREKEAQYAALLDRPSGALVLGALAAAVLLHAAVLAPGIVASRGAAASQPGGDPPRLLLTSLPPPPARRTQEAPTAREVPPRTERAVAAPASDPVQPPFPAIDTGAEPPEAEILPAEPEPIEPPPRPRRAVAEATQPVLIPESRVEPAYPEIARRGAYGARIVLRALVLASGAVGDVTVLRSSHPNLGFESAAIRAIRQWRYQPAVRDGRPVDAYVYVNVTFRPS